MSESNIHKLISLTFDENPKIRREAAKSLAEVDDPAALFALMELNYDKDLTVKKTAREALNKKKSNEREVMSFAEIFSVHTKPEENPIIENQEEKRKRVLQPIEQLFEKKLGKLRAEAVKGKMMPTIEKIYARVMNVKPSEAAHTGKSAIQEFLTSYLEAISDIDALTDAGHVEHPQAAQPDVQKTVEKIDPGQTTIPIISSNELSDQSELHESLEMVGSKHGDGKQVLEEIHNLDNVELDETEDPVSKLPSTFIKKAYETMMLSDGDEEMMKREMRRMMKDIEKDLKLAFMAAKKKYKETNVAHLTKLKEGMGTVNTDILSVKSAENLSYSTKKGDVTLCRIIVNDDEGNEGVVYLMDRNGEWLKSGMNIKVIRGQVKSFAQFGETAISVGKKGNIYIVL